jgi:hypothetical protein
MGPCCEEELADKNLYGEGVVAADWELAAWAIAFIVTAGDLPCLKLFLFLAVRSRDDQVLRDHGIRDWRRDAG